MARSSLLTYLDNFEELGSETAYVFRRGYRVERWSYGRVAETAYRFARDLEARGIGKGGRILLWGDNCAEWVAAFFGSILRGAVVVPMDRIASPEFATKVCRQINAPLCVCSRDLASSVSSVPVIVLEDLTVQLSGISGTRYKSPAVERDDPVQIVFTSGTTADPKGVVITHRNVLANIEPLEVEIGKYLKYERVVHPLRFLNLLPLSHVFGQFLGVFIPQLLGATVVFHDSLNPSEIIHTVKQERVSVLVGVPRILETLRGKVERDHESAGRLPWLSKELEDVQGRHFLRRWWRFRDIHRQFGWKFWAFISGGAALNPKTEQFWSRLGYVVIQGYGLTETTSIISVNHPFRLGRGSIGQVLPGRELKLDANGEILVRGASVASGYVSGEGLKPVAGEEGWFQTGDIGELDHSGNLYFKGRKKDVIVNPEGMNVFPEDLEAVLRCQPEVRDCMVFGFEREGNAEPCAVLILRSRSCEPEAVIRRANASLAQYQRIRRWFLWPEEDFPRTPTQKPKAAEIQDFVQMRLRGVERPEARAGSLADLISRITGRPVGGLVPDTNLATDLDLSSLDRVELLSALEDRYQVDLNESRFSDATTIRDLELMISEPVARRSDYHYPRWAQSLPVAAIRFLAYYLLSWPATLLMSYPRIRGREKLAGIRGPVLFIANHITQVDVGFVLAALPFRYRHRIAVAMLGEMLEEMRHPPENMGIFRRLIEQLSYFLVVSLFNVFPLPQQTGFRESFAFAGELADRGHSIVVFPEGRRTQDGRMSPFQAGVGLLARNLQLPIVPVRIDGLFELKQTGRKFSRPGSVTVSIGRALRFDPQTDPATIAHDLENRMRELGDDPRATGRV
jgi:long-chain acyl-CoA synthetase